MRRLLRRFLDREAKCGAQSWAYDDAGGLIIYGTCTLPAGHPTGWHQEWRDSEVWAEWRGPVEFVPQKAGR